MSFWSRIADIDQNLDKTSYYELLGVSENAQSDLIRERYYKLASKLHPDRYVARSSKEDLAALNRIHARMGEAKKILLSTEQRAAYDRGLANGNVRLEDTTDKPRKLSNRDPATPMARTLFEKAMAEIAAGSEGKAKANLTLAKQYEPTSKAIADALAKLEPPPEAPTTPPAPASSQPPPIPEPVEAAPSNRVHSRQSVALPVRLRIPTWERFEILYTRDISRGGMFLKSKKALPIGSLLNLNVMMPTGETVEIGAEVVHFRPATPGRPSGMGLRFATLAPETKSRLDAIMESKPKPTAEPLTLDDLVSELVRIRDLPAHELLQISEGASRDEARIAYESLTRKFHPHRNNAGKDPALFDICRELIGCVRLAYETVSKP